MHSVLLLMNHALGAAANDSCAQCCRCCGCGPMQVGRVLASRIEATTAGTASFRGQVYVASLTLAVGRGGCSAVTQALSGAQGGGEGGRVRGGGDGGGRGRGGGVKGGGQWVSPAGGEWWGA